MRAEGSQRPKDDQWLEEAWEGVVRTVVRNAERIGMAFPHATGEGGVYGHVKPHHWVAGFWPGLLWQVYRETGRSELADLAASCGRRIAETLGPFDLLHHDVGFMFSLSSVAEYKVTGDRDARRHGLMAASLLAGRFNPAGGFIRAWPDWDGEDHSGWAIIDCMMNIPLLYWASREEGDPRFGHIATLHADTVMKTFFRPDGSTHHIVTFDPETGQRSGALGGQGDSPDSAWARGTAWAHYGFALCHRYTGMPRFLHAAHAAADFFLAHVPEDGVPPWDFRPSPSAPPLKDSSAAACAASGLLELAALTPGPRGAAYRAGALQLLRALCERCAGWRDETNEGLLLHAAGHVPAGINLDVSLIYGDYFFAEAIVKLRGDRELFW
jgi:unsaturated chondroitin disaccharide hydrolase